MSDDMTRDRPRLAAYGKRIAAEATYEKGRAFVEAAMLVRRHGGYDGVVLHLLCQGVEALLKGLLLTMDYDRFNPKLPEFGHDLVPLAHEAAAAAGLKSPGAALVLELERLSELYSAGVPRYGTTYDIVVRPCNVKSDRMLRRMGALLRFVDRKSGVCPVARERLSDVRYRTNGTKVSIPTALPPMGKRT